MDAGFIYLFFIAFFAFSRASMIRSHQSSNSGSSTWHSGWVVMYSTVRRIPSAAVTVAWKPGTVPDAFVISDGGNLAVHSGSGQGLFSIQGQSAMLAAQAVEATLGRGTCEWQLVKKGPCYLVFRCSTCGYEHASSNTDACATELDPRYCPNCGREVVNDD